LLVSFRLKLYYKITEKTIFKITFFYEAKNFAFLLKKIQNWRFCNDFVMIGVIKIGDEKR